MLPPAQGLQDDPRLVAFEELDTDGDGQVSLDEFMAATREQLGAKDETAENRAAVMAFYADLFEAADITGDSLLNDREMEYAGALMRQAAMTHLHMRVQMVGQQATTADAEQPLEAEAAGKAEEPQEASVDDEGEGEDPDPHGFGIYFFEGLAKESDENGNGGVDKDEYLKAMKKTAVSDWGLEQWLDDPDVTEWLDKLWERADVTGDGILNGKEVQYTAYLADRDIRSGKFANKYVASMLLDQFDHDRDGKIKLSEIEEEEARAMAEVEEVLQDLKEAAEQEAQALKEAAAEEGSAEEKGEPAAETEEKAEKEEKEEATAEEEEAAEAKAETVFERLRRLFSGADANDDKVLDKAEVCELAKAIIKERDEL